MSKVRKELAYSPITDTVYWVDGRGKKTDVTPQFYSMIAMMAVQNATKNGGGFTFNTKGGKKITVIQEDITEAEQE